MEKAILLYRKSLEFQNKKKQKEKKSFKKQDKDLDFGTIVDFNFFNFVSLIEFVWLVLM